MNRQHVHTLCVYSKKTLFSEIMLHSRIKIAGKEQKAARLSYVIISESERDRNIHVHTQHICVRVAKMQTETSKPRHACVHACNKADVQRVKSRIKSHFYFL